MEGFEGTYRSEGNIAEISGKIKKKLIIEIEGFFFNSGMGFN